MDSPAETARQQLLDLLATNPQYRHLPPLDRLNIALRQGFTDRPAVEALPTDPFAEPDLEAESLAELRELDGDFSLSAKMVDGVNAVTIALGGSPNGWVLETAKQASWSDRSLNPIQAFEPGRFKTAGDFFSVVHADFKTLHWFEQARLDDLFGAAQASADDRGVSVDPARIEEEFLSAEPIAELARQPDEEVRLQTVAVLFSRSAEALLTARIGLFLARQFDDQEVHPPVRRAAEIGRTFVAAMRSEAEATIAQAEAAGWLIPEAAAADNVFATPNPWIYSKPEDISRALAKTAEVTGKTFDQRFLDSCVDRNRPIQLKQLPHERVIRGPATHSFFVYAEDSIDAFPDRLRAAVETYGYTLEDVPTDNPVRPGIQAIRTAADPPRRLDAVARALRENGYSLVGAEHRHITDQAELAGMWSPVGEMRAFNDAGVKSPFAFTVNDADLSDLTASVYPAFTAGA
jgi:hypothetical protein